MCSYNGYVMIGLMHELKEYNNMKFATLVSLHTSSSSMKYITYRCIYYFIYALNYEKS